MLVMVGLLTVFGGLLPFLAARDIVPPWIPITGTAYQGLIVVIGAIALFYGLRKDRYSL